jgi:hypothetical protein
MSTDEVVFEPKDLLHLLANNSLSVEDQYHLRIEYKRKANRRLLICCKLR